jgi:demethylmenaquinone methyltransferase/2-methoxy-6-polyprenyl-1,4-benzoquinol methylase
MQETALRIFRGLASSYERALDIATLRQDRYWKRWVIERAEIVPGDWVLDVGCGTCLLEETLDRLHCKVVGLDLTEQMVRIGQSKCIGCVEGLIVGDAEFLPFGDCSFDVVVSCYVPKYVRSARLAQQVARVLRPGGRVVLYDFVRPRGPLAPFLRVYIHGALRVWGFLLGLIGNEAGLTFRILPRIIEEARWSEAIEEAFGREGIQSLACTRLSGGVVCAFSGKKRGGIS